MNPLNFLPRVGDAMQIPGGALWCERWEVNRTHSYGEEYDGIVVFRFRTSDLSAASTTKRTLPEISVIEVGDGKVLPLTKGGAE